MPATTGYSDYEPLPNECAPATRAVLRWYNTATEIPPKAPAGGIAAPLQQEGSEAVCDLAEDRGSSSTASEKQRSEPPEAALPQTAGGYAGHP
jgi:hypothetical protein